MIRNFIVKCKMNKQTPLVEPQGNRIKQEISEKRNWSIEESISS